MSECDTSASGKFATTVCSTMRVKHVAVVHRTTGRREEITAVETEVAYNDLDFLSVAPTDSVRRNRTISGFASL